MSERLRRRLVERLERVSAITTTAVRDAFLEVPREAFIPGVVEQAGSEAAYRDEAYPTKTDDRGDAISSSSQPQIMALMLEQLRIEPGHRVLEIGTGTGYNAALLSHLVGRQGRVSSIELDPELAAIADETIRRTGHRVDVAVGDGRAGLPSRAPFDRIIVTASSPDVPRAFLEQLEDGGLLTVPLRITDSLPFQQIVVTFRRSRDAFESVSVIRGGFMRLRDRPSDRSLPWAETDVVAHGEEDPRGSFSGATWGELTDDVRARLTRLFLARPRAELLGIRLRGWRQWELQTFIAVSLDDDVLIGVSRDDLTNLSFLGTALPAVIDPMGIGFAHLAGRRTISRIDAFGEPYAGRRLHEVVEDWCQRDRPGAARLHVRVAYGASTSTAWRSKTRGECLISFDW